MALTHLIDTSVVTRLRHPEVAAEVLELAAAGRMARATITDLEVGYSARNAAEWDATTGALDIFDELDVGPEHFRRAIHVQRQLAFASQRGRKIPDLLIAAVAEYADLVVLHYDADFDLISAMTGQPTEWVVTSGTVD